MIQDTDENILDKRDRIAKLEKNLQEAIRLWTSQDIAGGEKNMFVQRRFFMSPIASSKNQKVNHVLMSIIQNRESPDRDFEAMFKRLSSLTDRYDIEFI